MGVLCAAGPRRYTFAHEQFFEFLAGTALAERLLECVSERPDELPSLLWSYVERATPVWDEIAAFAVQVAEEGVPGLGRRVVEWLLPSDPAEALRWAVRLQTASVVEMLLADFRNGSGWPHAWEPGHALGCIGSTQVVEGLAATVLGEDALAADLAARVLADIRSGPAIAALVSAAQSGITGPPLASVLEALASAETGAADECLATAFRASPGACPRSVFRRLGRARPAAMVEALHGAAPSLKVDVIGGLHGVVESETVGAIAAALRDPGAPVRRSAAVALGHLATPEVLATVVWAASRGHGNARRSALALLSRASCVGAMEKCHLFGWDAIDATSTDLGSVVTESLRPLLPAGMGADDCEACAEAVNALTQLICGQAVPALVQALSDTESGARSAAAEAIGRLGVRDALGCLMEMARSDADGVCRAAATRALGWLDARESVACLVELAEVAEQSVQTAALAGLRQSASASSVVPVAKLLRDCPNALVRAHCALVLGEIAVREAFRHAVGTELAGAATTGRDGRGTEVCVDLLAMLFSRMAGSDVTAAMVLTGIADGSLPGRACPTGGGAALPPGLDCVVPALMDALSCDPDPDVRRSAALALASVGAGEAVPVLCRALGDADSGVRWAAVFALRRADSVEARAAIANAAHVEGLMGGVEASCDARWFASGGTAVLDALANALPRAETNRWAAGVLATMDPLPVERVTALLACPEPLRRAGACMALGGAKAKSAIPLLAALLSDGSALVRGAAARALGRLGFQDAKALCRLLEDDDDGVREQAAIALGQLGRAEGMPILTKAMGRIPLEEDVAEALARTGEPEAAEALVDRLGALAPDQRPGIIRALQLFPDKRVLAGAILGKNATASLLLRTGAGADICGRRLSPAFAASRGQNGGGPRSRHSADVTERHRRPRAGAVGFPAECTALQTASAAASQRRAAFPLPAASGRSPAVAAPAPLRKEERQRLIRVRDEINRKLGSNWPMLGESDAFLRLCDLVMKYAKARGTVLILGESGAGKELVARAIHVCSGRASSPFHPVNCGAIGAQLLADDLFGHVKGAFTGAGRERAGVFEAAEGGTVFLDEIATASAEVQVALLRVVERGEYQRCGETTIRQANVRIVAATNQNLEASVREGTFREDLWYRLKALECRVPPLRERGEDVVLLAQSTLGRLTQRLGRETIPGFTESDILRMTEYPWPGNVREIENTIERWLAVGEGGSPLCIPDSGSSTPVPIPPEPAPKPVHWPRSTPSERMAVARHLGGNGRRFARAAYVDATGTPQRTASRDLRTLRDEGVLLQHKPTERGGGTTYSLAPLAPADPETRLPE